MRPKGWDTFRDCKNPYGVEYPTRRKEWEGAYEAGADAYAEELKKERVVLKIGDELIHTPGYILIQIPEEVE